MCVLDTSDMRIKAYNYNRVQNLQSTVMKSVEAMHRSIRGHGSIRGPMGPSEAMGPSEGPWVHPRGHWSVRGHGSIRPILCQPLAKRISNCSSSVRCNSWRFPTYRSAILIVVRLNYWEIPADHGWGLIFWLMRVKWKWWTVRMLAFLL